MKSQVLITIYCVGLLIPLANCQKEGDDVSTTEIMHPIEENIPHHNRNHLTVEKTGQPGNLQSMPDIISDFHRYLNDPEQVQLVGLDLLIGSGVLGLHVVSIDANRLVILDADRDHLFEYDLSTQDKITLAESGRGPEDIQFARDMIKQDNRIFIVREDMYISVYDCNSFPCEFEETISMDFRPISLTVADNRFAVLGFPGDNRPQNQSGDEPSGSFQPVRLLDSAGQYETSFGEIYDTEGHMMLLRPFISNGKIRYSPAEHLFILAYPRFPYLYIYEADNLTLKEIYRISDFTIGQQSYRPDERSLTIPMNDFSEIRSVVVIRDHMLLVETITLRNFNNVVGPENRWDRWCDYYIINLENRASYYLGGYENIGDTPWQYTYIAENGLMIYDDADGVLHLMGDL
jgi:hypothetical protein